MFASINRFIKKQKSYKTIIEPALELNVEPMNPSMPLLPRYHCGAQPCHCFPATIVEPTHADVDVILAVVEPIHAIASLPPSWSPPTLMWMSP